MKPRHAIILAGILLMASCSQPLTNQQKVVVGEWRAYNGMVKLAINSDGTFITKQYPNTYFVELHKYFGEPDKEGYRRGTWEVRTDNAMLVVFYYDGREIYMMRNGADMLYKEKSSLAFFRHKEND